MSLSFVSSAVLTSTDGISHNEEKELESKELEAVRKRNAGVNKSLFEQLRANQEEDAERELEQRRAEMRGTMALNSEDVEHLNFLERSKQESEEKIRTQVNQELELFRAAKEERIAGQIVVDDETNEDSKLRAKSIQPETSKSTSIQPIIPKIISKRKRRRDNNDENTNSKKKIPVPANTSEKTSVDTTNENTGLGGLLGGYGSSSSEDEDS